MKKVFLFIVFTFLLVSCGLETPAGAPELPKAETKAGIPPKTVVASFYPLAFMAEAIAGGHLDVINLAGAADVHAYRPTPQDIIKMNEAEMFLYQGAGLEAWAEDLEPSLARANVKTRAVSDFLDLKKVEAHDEHGHHEHHHEGVAPHTWLSPVLAQDMVNIIKDAIIEIDPEKKEIYTQKANELTQKFADLDKKYTAGLQNCQNNEVIVSHDAYGYLADEYGTTFHAIAGLSTQDEPSAKTLALLKEEAAEGITHILREENGVEVFSEALARETGLETLLFNPLGRGTPSLDDDFFTIMEKNLKNLRVALHCS